jgi:hypothetical protein
MKVQQKSKPELEEPEMGQQLDLADGRHMLDGLQLHDDYLFDDEVHAVAAVQSAALIDERQWNLPAENNASQGEFVSQTGLVSRLQETRSQSSMDFDGGPDDLVGQVVDFRLCGLCVFVFHLLFHPGSAGEGEKLNRKNSSPTESRFSPLLGGGHGDAMER